MNSIVKKTLVFAVVIAFVAGAGWIGRKVYRRATVRNLTAQARRYVDAKDYHNADLCLQRALQVNPASAEAVGLVGDLLEAVGSPAAVSWRIRTVQLQTNSTEARFSWARTALEFRDPVSAAQALGGVDSKSRSSATFHKLAGALAWSLHNAPEADRQYTEALRLEPTNQTLVLDLATIRLSSTNSAIADAARNSLQQIPAGSPLHATALRYLAVDAERKQSFQSAIACSRELIGSPEGTFVDRIALLQLLREAKSDEYNSWRREVEADARNSSEHAYALGRWMATTLTPADALHWLEALPAPVRTNMPVPLVMTDCQLAMKDWNGLLALSAGEDWGEFNYYRLAIESISQRSLGRTDAGQASWMKAFRLCTHRLDRLARLSQVAATWGWRPEKDQVLQEVVSEFPKEKWAADQLIESLYADGNTRGLADLLRKIYEADPLDNHLKNDLATVFLLQKSELDKACRLAREAYDSSTNNPYFASTYAYSLLLQNKPEEAARIVGSLKAEYLKIPSIAAYYGVVEASVGHKDAALEPLKRAEASRLLPEEKEMVKQAIARL